MNSIKSPSEYLMTLFRRLSPETKLAFLSTFISGFLCHLYIFTNSMYNNDDIRYLYVTFDKPELGRWLQTYAAGISSYFSLPVVNGILGLFWLSLASMVLVKIFDLKNRLFIVMTGALLAVFPSVATIYSYMFAADPFFLACLLSILAAYLVTRNGRKYAWIGGAALLCCSVGIYQAYLPFTLLLMLLYFMLMLLQPAKYDDKTVISAIPRYLIMLACGMGAYYVFMQLTLRLKHITLSDYQGIGESTFPGIGEIKGRILRTFTDFYEFFKPSQVLTFNRWMQAAALICLLLLAVFFFTLYGKNRVYKSWLRNVLLVLCIICIPICTNVIYLISDGVTYHMLMRHVWCLLFMAVLIFCESTAPSLHLNTAKLLEWGAALAALVIIWNYILLNNIAYFNMNFRYEKTYALCLKIVDRLEQQEDYDDDRPIAFIGRYSKTYRMDASEELLDPMTGMKGPRVFMDSSRAFLPFMQNCLGEDITIATPEQEEAIRATEEFQSMPRFPHDGSIRIINDITVVKLNE